MLLAAVWLRSERGRTTQNGGPMPERLAGCCTTLAEALAVCRERPPTLLVATQLLEEGTGLELIVEAKRLLPALRTLLFLEHDHRTLLEETLKTHSDGIVLEAEIGSGHVIRALAAVSKGGFYLEPAIAQRLHGSARRQQLGPSERAQAVMQEIAMVKAIERSVSARTSPPTPRSVISNRCARN